MHLPEPSQRHTSPPSAGFYWLPISPSTQRSERPPAHHSYPATLRGVFPSSLPKIGYSQGLERK